MIPITIFLKTIQWIFSRIFRLIFLFCSLEKLGSFNLGSYLGQGCQICTKWDKSRNFIDQVSVHFGSTNQNVLKCDFKKFRICSISCQSVPVQGSCQASGIYKATVKTNNKTVTYIGCPNNFNKRYSTHKNKLYYEKNTTAIALSSFICYGNRI